MSGPFSRTTLWVIVPIAVVSFVVTVVLTVFGDDLGEQPSAGADAYSHSALGHRGLVELLRRLDVPVVVSRSDSAAKTGAGLLVIAEPTLAPGGAAAAELRREIGAARRTLLILPKWYGVLARDRRWVDDADLEPTDEVASVLQAAGITATLDRAQAPARWRGRDELDRPVIREPQTVHGEAIDPIVQSDAGTLFGKALVDGREVYVLADPDVLNNFGLREPANARLAVALIDELREGGGVVFDEATHGYTSSPSIYSALFRFPLVLATLQLLNCVLLISWAAMVRSGPKKAAPPPIAPGKDFLIDSTASLLRFGGHHADALRRYLASTVQAVRHALHAPSDLPPPALTQWLERVRVARHGQVSLVELTGAVEALPPNPPPQRVVALADQVHRWRQEMTHGSRDRS